MAAEEQRRLLLPYSPRESHVRHACLIKPHTNSLTHSCIAKSILVGFRDHKCDMNKRDVCMSVAIGQNTEDWKHMRGLQLTLVEHESVRFMSAQMDEYK